MTSERRQGDVCVTLLTACERLECWVIRQVLSTRHAPCCQTLTQTGIATFRRTSYVTSSFLRRHSYADCMMPSTWAQHKQVHVHFQSGCPQCRRGDDGRTDERWRRRRATGGWAAETDERNNVSVLKANRLLQSLCISHPIYCFYIKSLHCFVLFSDFVNSV